MMLSEAHSSSMQHLILKTSRIAEWIPQQIERVEREVTHTASGKQEGMLETELPKKRSEARMNEGCCGLKSARQEFMACAA
jgi:hypothetical protein